MSDQSKIIAVIATIAIPVVAFLGGMYSQHLISERSLKFQQFSTATNLIATDAVKKDEGLRTWAESTIREYTKIQQQIVPTAVVSKDFYIVSKEFAENVCLFPQELFSRLNRPVPMPLKEGDDMRVAFAQSRVDFLELRGYYDLVIDTLKSTCGFLERRR